MSKPTARITILTPCFNERDNVRPLHERVRQVMDAVPGTTWEHLFIDNASTDGTQEELRKLAAEAAGDWRKEEGGGREEQRAGSEEQGARDRGPRVKVILNQRNFGHVRSPFHGLLQAPGDAVIVMAADGQDPAELIPEFIKKWREGFPVVMGQKVNSEESWLFFTLRRFYYRLVKRLADVELIENATGFGLYDRKVIEALRTLDDPYPYVRGLVCELGFPVARVPYEQPKRKRGITKNNFYTLYDVAMLGITSHSKVPLRLATMLGFAASAASFLIGLVYLAYKLVFWDRFALGVAPVVIGLFFFGSVQLFFIGVIGEYIGAIHTKVTKRPLVVEKARIGF